MASPFVHIAVTSHPVLSKVSKPSWYFQEKLIYI